MSLKMKPFKAKLFWEEQKNYCKMLLIAFNRSSIEHLGMNSNRYIQIKQTKKQRG